MEPLTKSAMSIFDIIIILVAVASFLTGMRKGLIRELAVFLGYIVGIYFAAKFSGVTENALAERFSFAGIGAISFVITLAIVVVAVHFVANIVNKAVGMTILSLPNRLLGGIFSTLKNLFFISCLVCVANYFVDDVLEKISPEEKEKSVTYEPITEISAYLFPYLDFGINKIRESIE